MNRPAAHFADQEVSPCEVSDLRSKLGADTRCALLQTFSFEHIEDREPHPARYGVAACGRKELAFFDQ